MYCVFFATCMINRKVASWNGQRTVSLCSVRVVGTDKRRVPTARQSVVDWRRVKPWLTPAQLTTVDVHCQLAGRRDSFRFVSDAAAGLALPCRAAAFATLRWIYCANHRILILILAFLANCQHNSVTCLFHWNGSAVYDIQRIRLMLTL